jgi:VanZ family protein
MRIKNLILHFWKSLIITAGILYLSFAPPSTFKGIPTFENEDKLVHLLMYAGLTCTLIFDYWKSSKSITFTTLSFILICVAFPIILGGVVEIIQPMYFAPRTADWFDWFSDIAGVLLGLMCMQFLKKLKILT